MTMFKKVFGNQMAASESHQQDIATPPEPEPQLEVEEDIARRPVRSQPMFVPVPQVLSIKEEENAARRAEKLADQQERMRVRTAAPKAPVQPASQAEVPAQFPSATAGAAPPTPPAASTPARPAGRARTRLLGFGQPDDAVADPMAGPAVTPAARQYPTGWIVVVSGPGRGHFFPLFSGVSTIGRDAEQAIALDFGDMTVSRENHAAIAYDSEDNQFYIGHGGKSNIIRLNSRPVLSTEQLHNGDRLRIGETVLQFVAFCGPDFDWTVEDHD